MSIVQDQWRRQEYAGPRADHDSAGPEYRYLDWYATANTDYVQTRSTFATWRKNLVFSLFINFFLVCGQRVFFIVCTLLSSTLTLSA